MTHDHQTTDDDQPRRWGRRIVSFATTLVLASGLALGGATAAQADDQSAVLDARHGLPTVVAAEVQGEQWTGFRPTLKGPEYWISDDNVRRVIDGIRSGTLDRVLDALPGVGIVAKVLAGPMASFGADKLEKCAVAKKGIVIRLPWIGFPTCRAQ